MSVYRKDEIMNISFTVTLPPTPQKKDRSNKIKMKIPHAASPNVILKVWLSCGLCVVVALKEKLLKLYLCRSGEWRMILET